MLEEDISAHNKSVNNKKSKGKGKAKKNDSSDSEEDFMPVKKARVRVSFYLRLFAHQIDIDALSLGSRETEKTSSFAR